LEIVIPEHRQVGEIGSLFILILFSSSECVDDDGTIERRNALKFRSVKSQSQIHRAQRINGTNSRKTAKSRFWNFVSHSA
jgi:hypothetical protein